MYSLVKQYERSPYPALTHAFTHPATIGALARLYGLEGQDPSRARVLDVGTGCGANLLWIARSLPNSECVGIDFVAESIREAQQESQIKGINNATFYAADLLEHDFGSERFDYIIAHGFFSWTPEDVQQRLLDLCRDHLSERGIAMISYNTMPGCAARDAIRRLLLLEMDDQQMDSSKNLIEQLEWACNQVLSFFETALPGIENLPHAKLLRSNVELLSRKEKAVLLHDELGQIFEPFYLLQFTQWLTETQLAYIADTDMRMDWMAVYPKHLRRAIAAAKMPRLKALQYADYLFNTSFRRSLVCRIEDAQSLRPMPDLTAVKELWVTSRLQPENEREFVPGSPVRYCVQTSESSDASGLSFLEVSDGLTQAVFSELARHRNRAVKMADVYSQAMKRAGSLAGLESDAVAEIGRIVLRAVCQNMVSLTYEPNKH